MFTLDSLSPDRPVLIAGPTASGKSALALEIVKRQGGVIINADALQVYDGWRVLTARPSAEDEARAPHRLYGHVPFWQDYSVGHWLRDVIPYLDGPARPVIIGGTGLNFAALTEGLADIPPTPPEIRAEGDRLTRAAMLADLQMGDPEILCKIDQQNPMRVQRAWEVLRTTGRPLSAWHAETPPPALPLERCHAVVIEADKNWLNERIERRFDLMLQQGALEEARALAPDWHRAGGAAKAIGGPEMIAHVTGKMGLEEARTSAIIGTRQYAKRQRTWFRARMKSWQKLAYPTA